MRIFFVNAYFDPNLYEGSRVHIEQLIRNLIEMGHEVWVPPTSPVDFANKLPRNYVKRFTKLRDMDILYLRVEGRPLVLSRYMRGSLKNYWVKWMQGFWGNSGFKKKVVWEINAASDYVALAHESTAQLTREKLDIELRDQAQYVNLAICNTDGLAKYANDLGISRTRIIPLGTVPEMFGEHVSPAPNISRSPNRLNVVWCGNPHTPWHDIETIRKSAWRLQKDERIRFYFIGEYPPGMHFTDNVISKGPIKYEEMPHYLSAMDVGLAIYRNASWSRYGVFSSPLKLFDYFAAELAVIASPIEQVLECVENERNGFIVPFENEEALTERLRFLAEHKDQIKYIGKRARELTTNYYNWRRVAEETVNAMQDLFNKDA